MIEIFVYSKHITLSSGHSKHQGFWEMTTDIFGPKMFSRNGIEGIFKGIVNNSDFVFLPAMTKVTAI